MVCRPTNNKLGINYGPRLNYLGASDKSQVYFFKGLKKTIFGMSLLRLRTILLIFGHEHSCSERFLFKSVVAVSSGTQIPEQLRRSFQDLTITNKD